MNTIDSNLRNLNIPYKEAELLLSFVLKKDIVYLKSHLDDTVDGKQKKDYLKLIRRREAGEPIAYLIRKKSFLDCDFKVNKNVLIPRFETETLVEQIIQEQKNNNLKNLLEIGTGSGCISICLAKHLNLDKIIATDISDSALRVADYNNKKLKTNVNFIKADLLSTEIKQMFNNDTNLILVANLPYLPYDYKQDMELEVKGFEPHLALFTDDQGLFLVKRLIEQFLVLLNESSIKKYVLYLEIEPFQINLIMEYAKKILGDVKIKKTKDLKHDFRFLKIYN